MIKVTSVQAQRNSRCPPSHMAAWWINGSCSALPGPLCCQTSALKARAPHLPWSLAMVTLVRTTGVCLCHSSFIQRDGYMVWHQQNPPKIPVIMTFPTENNYREKIPPFSLLLLGNLEHQWHMREWWLGRDWGIMHHLLMWKELRIIPYFLLAIGPQFCLAEMASFESGPSEGHCTPRWEMSPFAGLLCIPQFLLGT